MTRESFEYAIRKDVRNNPIVRQIDRDRQREFWHAAGIATFLVVVVLFRAGQHFDWLQDGYRLEDLQEAQAVEAGINRHLRLEIDTLRSPARIEPLAMQELGMVRPGPQEAAVLARVIQVPPPVSVVARR